MDRLRTIVVGVDFSECSAAALRTALRLAESPGAVHAIHVIDALAVSAAPRLESDLRRAIEGSLTEQAQRAWEGLVRQVPGAEAARFTALLAPRTAALRDAAVAEGAELLVVGAFGDRRPNVGLGTMATACVRHASVPVLLVRTGGRESLRRVGAFVDFSETSRAALGLAARIAAVERAALVAVHVFDAPWRRLTYLAAAPIVDPAFERAQLEELRSRLRRFVDQSLGSAAEGVAVDVHDRPGGHRIGIAEYAESEGLDLVAMGTRGGRNLRDALLGSTAERALRDVAVSLLAVPAAPTDA
ncbi:MAG TPA: universal stress protein [Phycisphaerales bacterium]|nr:universal stress protein [Phycisphaerales bacterium]HMP36253.1 universal stress protein [Phycisphaerales bacterium]